MKHYCNKCRCYTETIDTTDCIVCLLSKTNGNLDENKNEFNKGIEHTFEYIEKHIIGRVVNGKLEGVITEDQLKEIRNTIPRKCDSCNNPCGKTWCPTKE